MANVLQVKDDKGNWIAIPSTVGPKGEDGFSCTHSWNGTTLTVTSASGTSSANLQGQKGDKGDKGDPGEMSASVYDPQGKAQDIFAYVDAAITGAIGRSY